MVPSRFKCRRPHPKVERNYFSRGLPEINDGLISESDDLHFDPILDDAIDHNNFVNFLFKLSEFGFRQATVLLNYFIVNAKKMMPLF